MNATEYSPKYTRRSLGVQISNGSPDHFRRRHHIRRKARATGVATALTGMLYGRPAHQVAGAGRAGERYPYQTISRRRVLVVCTWASFRQDLDPTFPVDVAPRRACPTISAQLRHTSNSAQKNKGAAEDEPLRRLRFSVAEGDSNPRPYDNRHALPLLCRELAIRRPDQ